MPSGQLPEIRFACSSRHREKQYWISGQNGNEQRLVLNIMHTLQIDACLPDRLSILIGDAGATAGRLGFHVLGVVRR